MDLHNKFNSIYNSNYFSIVCFNLLKYGIRLILDYLRTSNFSLAWGSTMTIRLFFLLLIAMKILRKGKNNRKLK